MVGTRRERINRLLKSWNQDRLIEYDHEKYVILDLPSIKLKLNQRIESNAKDIKW